MAVNEEAPLSEESRRVRVARGACPWAEGQLEVVHVGQSAVILTGDAPVRRSPLVAVTSPSRGLVPGGICLADDAELEHLRAIALVARTGSGLLDLGRWMRRAPREITIVDLRMPPVTLQPPAVAMLRAAVTASTLSRVDPLMDSRPQRRLAAALAEAAVNDDETTLRHHLLTLVGAGPGTTPAGDDVVVGALASLAATHLRAHARVARLLPPLLVRTTTASRHDLLAAADGDFSEHLHQIVRALTDEHLVDATVARARTWGATSGLDHAAGAASAASVVLRHASVAPASPATGPLDPHHLRRSA